MRIPNGDLAPARRRRYGGGYGRRRRRRSLRIVVGLLLALVAASGAYTLRQNDATVPDRLAVRSCPTATASPTTTASPAAKAVATVPVALPQPQQVRLVLLNGTPRNLLAKTVGDQLAALGFVVSGQSNAPAALTGASTVTYGPGAGPAGTLVSRWVLGARLVAGPKAPRGSVQVVLGSGFTRLATPAEVADAGRPAVVPSASPSVAASGCPA